MIYSQADWYIDQSVFVAAYETAEVAFRTGEQLAADTNNSQTQIFAVAAIGDLNVGNLALNNIFNSLNMGQIPNPVE
jgi:hypothetical protein